jgi:hypothetical protein
VVGVQSVLALQVRASTTCLSDITTYIVSIECVGDEDLFLTSILLSTRNLETEFKCCRDPSLSAQAGLCTGRILQRAGGRKYQRQFRYHL